MFGAIASAIGGLVSEPIKQWQKRKTLKTEHKFELEKLDHEANLAKALVQGEDSNPLLTKYTTVLQERQSARDLINQLEVV